MDPRSTRRCCGSDRHLGGVLGARGAQPDTRQLKKLAGILGVEPGDLLDIPQSEWGQNEWRVTNGLEQKEVAAALGMSPTTLSAVEATYAHSRPGCRRGSRLSMAQQPPKSSLHGRGTGDG